MPDAPTQPAEPLDRAVRSVYRAIWNREYVVDLAANGRCGSHRLAEQIAGALAKDGLLAPPMAEGLDYSALADACDDYLDAYRGDGPDERIGVAAARVRDAAGLPAAPAPPTDVIEEAAAILAARHSDRAWGDLSTHRQEYYRQDARALATAGHLAAPQPPDIPGPERDRLCQEAKELGLAEAYLDGAARKRRSGRRESCGPSTIGARDSDAHPVLQWAMLARVGVTEVLSTSDVAAPADDEAASTVRTLHVTATRDIPEGHTDQRVRYEYEGDSWEAWFIAFGKGENGEEAYLMRDNGERWVVMADNITQVDSAAGTP